MPLPLQSYGPFLEVLQRDQAIHLAAMEAAYCAQWRKDLLGPQAAPIADAEAAGQAAPSSDSQLQSAAIDASASTAPGQSGAVQKEQQPGGVLLHDFHDLMEDLRKQLADIHAVNDTVGCQSQRCVHRAWLSQLAEHKNRAEYQDCIQQMQQTCLVAFHQNPLLSMPLQVYHLQG